MMALRGVRSSWLMLARNTLLARLAASAASLAFCNSTSVSSRTWISFSRAAFAPDSFSVRHSPLLRPLQHALLQRGVGLVERPGTAVQLHDHAAHVDDQQHGDQIQIEPVGVGPLQRLLVVALVGLVQPAGLLRGGRRQEAV